MTIIFFKKLFLGVVLFYSFSALAGEMVIEVESDKSDEKGIIKTAVKKLSYQLIEKTLEPSQFQKKQEEINKIIAKKSNRYILYTKKGVSRKQKNPPSSFITPITIGFSEENLQKILMEEEVFYADSVHTRVLPLVSLEDKTKRKTYSWWTPHIEKGSELQQNSMNAFYSQVQSELMTYGFYLVNPEFAGFRRFTSKELQFAVPKKRAVSNLAKHFNTYIVLAGSIKIKEMESDSMFNIKTDLKVYHLKSGRSLAEAKKSENIILPLTKSAAEHQDQENKSLQALSFFLKKQKEFSKGLGLQMQSLYNIGLMSSSLLKVTVQGKLAYRHFESFKKQLISKVKLIKSLQEHIINSHAVTYLANTKQGDIASAVLKVQFSGFDVDIKNQYKNEIILRVSLK